MKQKINISKVRFLSPLHIFLLTVVSIFVAEAFIMSLLPVMPDYSLYSVALIDSTLLSVISVPMLYWLLFRPLVLHIKERDLAEKGLQQAHHELESRVEERTAELEMANKKMQEEVAKHKTTKARFEHLLSVSPAVIYACKPEGDYRVTFISENIKNQLSYEPKDFVDDSNFWADNIHPEDKERVFAELPELFKQGHYSHTYRFKHKNGTYRWMHDELRLFSGDDGIPKEIVGSWLDITKRVQLEEELRKTATTDKLTKAYNRVKFEEIVAEEMERARRYNRPLSMLIFDIDNFKEVNDTYGHLAGDYALKTIADIVRSQMRKINHLVRWGGDEFVIIPVETGLEGARVLSERIREAISSFDFDEAGKITVSIGTAQFDKADTEDDFLKRADDALYKAKEAGGNCVVVGVSRCAALHDSDFSEVLKSKNL